MSRTAFLTSFFRTPVVVTYRTNCGLLKQHNQRGRAARTPGVSLQNTPYSLAIGRWPPLILQIARQTLQGGEETRFLGRALQDAGKRESCWNARSDSYDRSSRFNSITTAFRSYSAATASITKKIDDQNCTGLGHVFAGKLFIFECQGAMS